MSPKVKINIFIWKCALPNYVNNTNKCRRRWPDASGKEKCRSSLRAHCESLHSILTHDVWFVAYGVELNNLSS